MDTAEREHIVRALAKIEGLVATELASAQVSLGLLSLEREYRNLLANLIPENAYSTEVVNEWRQVSAELRYSHSESESYFARRTLPIVQRTQNNRFRLEQEDFLLIRQPYFSQYEKAVLLTRQMQFFGLTGPQGFGKSTFLHYFATKYCHGGDYIVAYLPVCPPDTNLLKRALAQAFYRGCQIADLSGYKELTRLDNLPQILSTCADFARSKQHTLLLVIDQMKLDPQELFNSTINAILSMTGSEIKVVVSLSISNRVSSVFGNSIQSLSRYAHRITSAEAALLATHPSADDITAATLTELPFQVVAEKLKGLQLPLVELAKCLAEDLLTNYGDARHQQAYFYLQMAADGTTKYAERDCDFGLTLDGDHFYSHQGGDGRYFIAEHRDGFAAEVIAIMRSRRGDYAQYLLHVLDNVNFMTMDAGARGRIVEDCFAIILRDEAVVQLPFVKIPGHGATAPKHVRLEAPKKLVFDVPAGNEAVPRAITWLPDAETLVFIPLNRQYKGIDFVIARKTDKTLYIYYVQCTIQLPQNHSICESELYAQWENLLKGASRTNKCYSFLVFLTPHSSNLNVPAAECTADFFQRKTKLHVQFARIEGAHALLDKIRIRFANF